MKVGTGFPQDFVDVMQIQLLRRMSFLEDDSCEVVFVHTILAVLSNKIEKLERQS